MSGDAPDAGAPPASTVGLGLTEEYLDARPTQEPAPEAGFALTTSPASPWDVRVVMARAREGLSELYEAAIEVCTPDPTFAPDVLLGARAVLEMTRGPRTRRFCGVVRRVERLDSFGTHRRARLFVVPAAYALTQRTDSRVFQNKTAVDVVKDVWAAAGLDPTTLHANLSREYTPREYCVQYRETDLAFVSRLLEDEGIAYWFEHEGATEVLTLADSDSWPLCPTIDRRPVPFAPPHMPVAPVEVVQKLDFGLELRATGVTVRDYDFTRPAAQQDMTREHPRGELGARARYEYPGSFTLSAYSDGEHKYGKHDGVRRAELRHQEAQATAGVGHGTGNVTGFSPGRAFVVLGHEHADLDRRYLLTRVVHHLSAPEELLSEGAVPAPAAGRDRYRNEFECVPTDSPWVPARVTPRPTVPGTQTAAVVGPAGEEIYTDHHGRIKVQFHWDRQGKRNDKSSCWVRVAQVWAGPGWGFQFLPRIGMEVVVQFLEGEPDQPLVTGCVYNGTNQTPYALPDEKTRSAIKSQSSPGGNGSNELRFEDKAGEEELYVHAQRDHNEVVERHHDEHVKGNKTAHIEGHYKVVIDGEGEKPAGMPRPGLELVALKQITLRCGESSIELTPDGITLRSNDVTIKSLGSHLTDSDGTVTIKAKGESLIKGAKIKLST